DDLYTQDSEAALVEDESHRRLTASEIVFAIVSRDWANARLASGTGFRLNVLRDLVGNTICGDLLDYLHRDWLHLGKPRFFDPRLLDYIEVRKRKVPG